MDDESGESAQKDDVRGAGDDLTDVQFTSQKCGRRRDKRMISDIVENDVHFQLNASFHAAAEAHVFQLVPELLPGDNLPYSTTT